MTKNKDKIFFPPVIPLVYTGKSLAQDPFQISKFKPCIHIHVGSSTRMYATCEFIFMRSDLSSIFLNTPYTHWKFHKKAWKNNVISCIPEIGLDIIQILFNL